MHMKFFPNFRFLIILVNQNALFFGLIFLHLHSVLKINLQFE